jgi:hypothetical protein
VAACASDGFGADRARAARIVQELTSLCAFGIDVTAPPPSAWCCTGSGPRDRSRCLTGCSASARHARTTMMHTNRHRSGYGASVGRHHVRAETSRRNGQEIVRHTLGFEASALVADVALVAGASHANLGGRWDLRSLRTEAEAAIVEVQRCCWTWHVACSMWHVACSNMACCMF